MLMKLIYDQKDLNRRAVPNLPLIRIARSLLILIMIAGMPLMNVDAAAVQPQTVTGIVLDDAGMALPGVYVTVKGTTRGSMTDADGNYSVEVEGANDILVFSFIGTETQEIAVGNQTSINVTLATEAAQLQDIVVIGYGTVRKSDLTGSVGSIKNEAIKSTPTVRLDDALRGKVAGLQATPTSSRPGSATSMRIRGSNSISANNEPLYVIDGHIGGFNLSDININSIESVEVLKDASATAIYGSRGSNGVILITTTRGKAGKPKVTIESFLSLQSPMRLLDMLNGAEYAEFMNENKGAIIYPDPASIGEGTNWQEEVYRKNAPMVSHSLSVSGGNDVSTYYLSGNFTDQEGLSVNSNMKRYHFRINTDHNITDKIKVGNSLFINNRQNKPGAFGIEGGVKNTVAWEPTLPVKDDQGNYSIQYASPEMKNDNPVAWANVREETSKNMKVLGNIFGEVEIIPGLKYRLNMGVNMGNDKTEIYLPSSLYDQKVYQGTARISHSEIVDILIENTINYQKVIGDHSISGLLGYTRQTIARTNSMVEARTFVTDAFQFNNLGSGAERSDVGSGASDEGLESYLFRANYGFQSKYLITASARYDGASVFAENNKWGLFPSVAVAWRAINEDFIQNLGVFSNLKVRASWGRLGNPGLDPGASLSQLSQSGNNYILGVDQHVVSGIAANTLGNSDLKWETTNQLNVGLDAAFFDWRLQVTLDYYDKMTEDLLVEVPLLWLTSFTTSLSNYGSVSNKGLELTVSSVNVSSGDFTWQTTFNIAGNRNKIVTLLAPEGFIYTNSFGWGNTSGILQEGSPIGTFYGMRQDGIWNTQEEIDAAGLTGHGVFPGGKRYKDIDGDGVIDRTVDREIMGDANPDFFGGIMNTISYKGLELFFNFSFSYGNDVYNYTNQTIGTAFDINVLGKFRDRWTPTNTESNIPSIAGIQRPQITSNDEDLEDGSYLRMRDIRLSYNIPVGKLSWIQAARVYVSGTNLLIFDNYSGFDPEINRGFSNTQRGYDMAQDPSVKSITMGVRLDF
jgi:TonB-dependent starch-binding outer membrane protein SusC